MVLVFYKIEEKYFRQTNGLFYLGSKIGFRDKEAHEAMIAE
jgi:hypothetical protein